MYLLLFCQNGLHVLKWLAQSVFYFRNGVENPLMSYMNGSIALVLVVPINILHILICPSVVGFHRKYMYHCFLC